MRAAVAPLVATVLLLGGCSPAYDTDGWTTTDFDGGSLQLPPTWTTGSAPSRSDALLSSGLVQDGDRVARVDVFREEAPRPVSRQAADDGSDPSFDAVRCPGVEIRDTREVEVDGGVASVNVFRGAVRRSGPVRSTTVVCASYAGDVDSPSVQVVLSGGTDALPESTWRPVVASVRLDER